MRRPIALAVLAIAAFSASAWAATDIDIDRVSLPVRGKAVRVDFPVGELRVEATDGSRVTVELRAHCKNMRDSKCEDYAERVTLETDESSRELRIQVKGYPKGHTGGFDLKGIVRVPREVALKIDMGVGALRIIDMEGDLDVDLGVGDADIRSPEAAIGSVDVDTGVGDASVIADGNRVRRRGFISSSASWEGRGRSNVSLHVGVGDAKVHVD